MLACSGPGPSTSRWSSTGTRTTSTSSSTRWTSAPLSSAWSRAHTARRSSSGRTATWSGPTRAPTTPSAAMCGTWSRCCRCGGPMGLQGRPHATHAARLPRRLPRRRAGMRVDPHGVAAGVEGSHCVGRAEGQSLAGSMLPCGPWPRMNACMNMQQPSDQHAVMRAACPTRSPALPAAISASTCTVQQRLPQAPSDTE